MSAHEKENGKGAEPDWVGLRCDADGRTEQWGQSVGQGSNLSPMTLFIERKQNPP